MKHLLKHEGATLLIALISSFLLILGSGEWLLGLVPFLFLAWWLYMRLLRLQLWIESGMRPARAPEDGGLVGEIVRLLLHRQRAQEKRKKRVKRLLRRINSQIAALPDATLILGPDLEIEWANTPAEQLLGVRYPADRGIALGNLLRDEKLIRYIRVPREGKPLERVSPLNPNVQLRYRAVSFGKGQRLLIARNISEQKQLEDALRQFIAHASHELKTPLTTLLGYLEMLEDESGLTESGQKALSVARSQGQRIESLIRDLLQLSRLDSLKLDPEQGEILHPLVLTRELLETLPSEKLKHRVQLECDPQIRLRASPREVESIVHNLLDNALKYTSDVVRIHWHQEPSGNIRLVVEDHGPGISRADLSAIRQRYYRGKETTSRQIAGSGLGLAIADQAARLHGACLTIESDVGRGSRFSVLFPAWRNPLHQDKPQKILRM